MRILFVNPYYKPYLGGIERIIDQLSAELLRTAPVEAVGLLTTRVYFPNRVMTELPQRETVDGVTVFRVKFRPASLPRVFHSASAGYIGFGFVQVLREFKPDIVHFTYSEWWSVNLLTYLASRRLPHVLSTFYHDVPRTTSTAPLFRVNRWLAPRMASVHVLSEFEARQVQHAYGVPAHRTVVIPPGVNLPATVPNRANRSDLAILAVGRLVRNKGQLELVQIFHRLKQKDPTGAFRLWLVGDDAGDGPAIRDYITQHRLGASIDIFGRCSDEQLQQLYRDADIFALPTKIESFGLVFLEAMAHGLPVVTYDTGPVRSVLTSGAFVVPLSDEDAFLEALNALLQDTSLRHDMGRAARRMAEQTFCWRTIGERFVSLYQSCLARG